MSGHDWLRALNGDMVCALCRVRMGAIGTTPPCKAGVCARCGHPAAHHDDGGASCWTCIDGAQTWDDPACPCSWYEATP